MTKMVSILDRMVPLRGEKDMAARMEVDLPGSAMG